MATKEDIVRIIENYYGVRYKDFLEKYSSCYPINIAQDITILLYRKRLGMKIKDIAAIFNITQRAVYYRLNSILHKMQPKSKLLKEYSEINELLNK